MDNWPLWLVAVVFVLAAGVIAYAGSRLVNVADQLADVTGMGEAVFGAVFLGGSTSLPGIVTSVAAAYQGYAEMSISNAVGGIAAQTAFLAIADIFYRNANLEHAAASVENLLQGTLLIALLTIPVLASAGPDVVLWQIHPATPLLFLSYLAGLRLIARARSMPLWRPQKTRETRVDVPSEEGIGGGERYGVWMRFAGCAAVVAVAGYAVAETGIGLADRTGLSQTIVGGLFTAVATSLPELVTAVAAVRQGALTLAVGDIIGGNCFDVLFLAAADVGYRQGSIYHAVTDRQVFLIALAILLTAVLLLGLLRREKHGIANIGFESVLVLLLYAGAFVLLLTIS